MQIEPMRYDPQLDPLVRRIRRRSARTSGILITAVVVLAGWIAIRELNLLSPNDDSGAPSSPRVVSDAEATKSTLLTQSESPGGGTIFDAHVSKRFVPGTRTRYGISTEIKGKGNPALEGSTGLRMCLETDLIAEVTEVLPDGSANLMFTFGDSNLYGNRFGYAVNTQRRDGITRSFADNMVAPVTTAANKNYTGPDLTAFDAPVQITMNAEGVVANRETENKIANIVGPIVQLSGTAFPDAELQIGSVWERRIEFEVPGMTQPVAAVVRSTLTGTDVYYGMPCIRIDNEIKPGEPDRNRVLQKIANVDVVGAGITLYDPNTQTMLYAKSDIALNLDLTGGLQSAADLLGSYSGLLEELEGGPQFDLEHYAKTAGSEPLGLQIRTQMGRKS